MFWLKKVLSQFLMPIPVLVLCLLMILFSLRRRERAQSLIVFALMLLILLSNSVTSNLLVQPLESQYRVNSRSVEGSCLVMVLGSSHDDSIQGSAVQQLSPTALARLTEGVRQMSLGRDCKLIVSGWNGGVSQFSHADVMARAAMELGVDENKIIKFPLARDTQEEAKYLQWEIGAEPVRLVTSATHMPRAMITFLRAGLTVEAAPTDFIGRTGYWWRLSADTLEASQRAIHEYLGLMWLKLKQE